MSFSLRFYTQRFVRRFPYFALLACLGAAVGTSFAVLLPPVYRAEARLLVESPQIPDELAASTVSAGASEMLQVIQQRLTTRARLLETARRLKIYENAPTMPPDKIVADMRRRLVITLPSTRSGGASFVTVSFDAPNAEMSATVTNEFVTSILQENVALRTATTAQTLDFFQQEVDRLGAELAQQSSKILEFKLKNKDALPDSLDYRRNRQSSQQERLLQLERELASLQDRRARLVEIFETNGSLDTVSPPRSPEEQELRKLKDQLSSALTIYSPQHPNVVMLKGKIAQLEEVVNQQLAADNPDASGATAFELQLADIDSQIAFAADQKVLIEKELEELKVSIDATPGNAIALDEMQRDYNNLQMQYNTAVDRMAQAATGDRIEALSKGQRITVIEQATAPEEPNSPNRKMIAGGGIAGGIAAGLGLVFLLEFMNRAVMRPVDISAKLGIQPFGTVPYIRTRQETLRRNAVIFGALLIALLGIPAALFAVHQYYLPIDLIINRLLERLT